MTSPHAFRSSRLALWATAVLSMGIVLVLLGMQWLPKRVPRTEPIRFSHRVHVKEADCEACHQYVTTHAAAGTPNLETCADCHDSIQSKDAAGKREEAKLQRYIKENKGIPWVRLPRLTDDIFFSHRRHVTVARKKITCETCHGPIAKTNVLPSKRAYQFTMEFCMRCHKERGANVDCISCHR
jgi:hypothetical protein